LFLHRGICRIRRLTVCVTGAGADGDSVWEKGKLEARIMLEMTAESPASSSRVREWRLGFDELILVSIPCHIEPDMRFSLIRLSDNLLPAAFKV